MDKMGGLEMGRPFLLPRFLPPRSLWPRSRHPELVSG
jgi:hypothetical protein